MRLSPSLHSAITLAVGASPLLSGCGRPFRHGAREASAPSEPWALIGANDMVRVSPPFTELPTPVRNAALATGRLSSPCTVTHLGEGLAITAAHCVPNLESPDCSSLTVLWDDPRTAREELPCQGVAFFEFTSGRDVAILRFAEYPAARVSFSTSFPTGSSLVGRTLTLLSHPGGGPLLSSGDCARLTPRDKVPSGQFAHGCDTLSGSSGAAVLDAVTGELVGVHSSGVSGSGEPYNLATQAGAIGFRR